MRTREIRPRGSHSLVCFLDSSVVKTMMLQTEEAEDSTCSLCVQLRNLLRKLLLLMVGLSLELATSLLRAFYGPRANSCRRGKEEEEEEFYIYFYV